jgi:tetratricopeptide (TPR) repeat protein
LNPKDPIHWGYLGDACNRTGDRDLAQAAWEKAIEIEPSYDYGGMSLFELHWQGGNFEAAVAIFAQIKPHLAPSESLD